jgi:hypothetical protein
MQVFVSSLLDMRREQMRLIRAYQQWSNERQQRIEAQWLIFNRLQQEPHKVWFETIVPNYAFEEIFEPEILDSRLLTADLIRASLGFIGDVLRAIQELQKRLACAALREQLRRKGKVKALNPPLSLNPKSLHPNKLAAQ